MALSGIFGHRNSVHDKSYLDSQAMNGKFVLSIQSDVVYGHVGLAAARPIFSAQGIELLGLPTVLLSHHPGHSAPRGRATPATEMESLVDGLESLGLLSRIDIVATGYFAQSGQIAAAARIIARLKSCNPAVQFWCDPVMGDEPRGLYVPDAVADALCAELVPLADLLLPNAFEARYLTGIDIRDRQSATEAARSLATREVLVTSVPDGHDRIGVVWKSPDDILFAADRRLESVAGGMGDSFAALILCQRMRGIDRPAALDHAMATLRALLDLPRDPVLPPELPLASASYLLAPG